MNAEPSEFMKIRRYVCDRIATSRGQPVRFPTTRELGRMFGVTQPTALRAVRDLIAEGILAPCKGGGTISQPRPGNIESYRIFGLLTRIGSQSFDVRYFKHMNSVVAEEINSRHETFCTLDLFLEAPSRLEKAVSSANLSGLVLLSPHPLLIRQAEKLRKKNFPVVAIMAESEMIPSVHVDEEALYREIFRTLFREKRSRILVVHEKNENHVSVVEKAVCLECEAHHVPKGHVMILDEVPGEMEKRVDALLEFGSRFDAVVFLPFLRGVYELLARRYDFQKECRIVCDELSVYRDMNFYGYAWSFAWHETACELVNNLIAQMNSEKESVFSRTMRFQLVSYRAGKPFSEQS